MGDFFSANDANGANENPIPALLLFPRAKMGEGGNVTNGAQMKDV
jgi:hypothetical protein